MILPIYLYGSQVLRTPAQEDDLSDKAWLKTFIADMVDTMHHADGCGLAAPQVGVSKRILVVDGNDLADRYPELKGFHREMINPSFTFESEKTCSYEEGCLSIPNVDADITRPETIRVRYLNLDFEEVEEEFTGFAGKTQAAVQQFVHIFITEAGSLQAGIMLLIVCSHGLILIFPAVHFHHPFCYC